MSSPGFARFRSRELRAVLEHLQLRVDHVRLHAVADGAGVHDLGQFVEPSSVLERYAEEFGDDVGGQRARDVVDEIALAALGHVVDDLACHVRDVVVAGVRPVAA